MTERIATNRKFYDKSVEYIELHDNGALMWVAEDEGNLFYSDGSVKRWLPRGVRLSCSIPVDVEFVEDFFTEIGRKFDASKLPSNVILYPYGR